MGGSQSRASASPAGAPSGGVAAGPPGSAPAPCAGMREQLEPGSDCPVPEEYRGKHGIFNVYNQPIDPRNNMPATASQAMAPGQRTRISTARQPSTIPKSGTSGTWTGQSFTGYDFASNGAENLVVVVDGTPVTVSLTIDCLVLASCASNFPANSS